MFQKKIVLRAASLVEFTCHVWCVAEVQKHYRSERVFQAFCSCARLIFWKRKRFHSVVLVRKTIRCAKSIRYISTALLNRWAAKLLQLGREMFRDNVIITPSHEFWNKFFLKWAQNQSFGEKWAATSKKLRSTALHDLHTCFLTAISIQLAKMTPLLPSW